MTSAASSSASASSPALPASAENSIGTSEILAMKSLDLYKNSPLALKIINLFTKTYFKDHLKYYLSVTPSHMHAQATESINLVKTRFIGFIMLLVKLKELPLGELELFIDLFEPGETPLETEVLLHMRNLLLNKIASLKHNTTPFLSLPHPHRKGISYFYIKDESKGWRSQLAYTDKASLVTLKESSFRGFFINEEHSPVEGSGFALNLRVLSTHQKSFEILSNIRQGKIVFNSENLIKTKTPFLMSFEASCVLEEPGVKSVYNYPILTVSGVFNLIEGTTTEPDIGFRLPPALETIPLELRPLYHKLYKQFQPYIAAKLLDLTKVILMDLETDFEKNYASMSFTQVFPPSVQMPCSYAQAVIELLQEAKEEGNEELIYYYLEQQDKSQFSIEEVTEAETELALLKPRLLKEDVSKEVSSSAAAPSASSSAPSPASAQINPYDLSTDLVAQVLINREVSKRVDQQLEEEGSKSNDLITREVSKLSIEDKKAIQPTKKELEIKAQIKEQRRKKYLTEQKYLRKEHVVSASASASSSSAVAPSSRNWIDFKKIEIRSLSSNFSAKAYLSAPRQKELQALKEGIPIPSKSYLAFKRELIIARAEALGIPYRTSGEGSHLVGHADRGFTLYFPHGKEYLPQAKEQLREAREILFLRNKKT